MADPTVIGCATACTVTVVHEISLPILNLSLEDGGKIAGGILAVWAVGYVFRVVAQSVSIGANTTSESEKS